MNFGKSGMLPVQPGTVSYIRVNLDVLPPNAAVAKATLRLYVNAEAAPVSFDVYEVDGDWAEDGVTYNSAPPIGASATGSHFT